MVSPMRLPGVGWGLWFGGEKATERMSGPPGSRIFCCPERGLAEVSRRPFAGNRTRCVCKAVDRLLAPRAVRIRFELCQCCSARGLRADRRDKLLKWLDTGGQNCTPSNTLLGIGTRLRPADYRDIVGQHV